MAAIVNHRIAGTRITVWDIFHHLENQWTIQEIADVLGLSYEQVQAAVDYIGEHEAEVRDGHRRIEERNTHGNSAEVNSRLAQARAKRLGWLTERNQERLQEAGCVGNRT